jgi:Ca2+:H+ antiporter
LLGIAADAKRMIWRLGLIQCLAPSLAYRVPCCDKLLAMKFLNILLLFIPLPILGKALGWSPTLVFVAACLGIIPLAAWMGKATEHLADRVGFALGGLLNATFGNACELIIAFFALKAGLVDVVKASITGSIVGNILLVLGGCMLAGGLKYEKQHFNRIAATTSATLLALAAISLVFPAVFHYSAKAHVNETKLALAIACLQFITYILGLVFSLKTHRNLLSPPAAASETDAVLGTIGWTLRKSLLVLISATVLVAVLSEYLVGSIEIAATQMGMSKIFIGVILVAIVGNAAEHSTAILMAMKNKMDLAMNIALGSGTQIALFVAPVIVFASFIIGKPMNLCFSEMELVSIIVSVLILSFVVNDGECNWLEGVQLLSVYSILAVTFYFY